MFLVPTDILACKHSNCKGLGLDPSRETGMVEDTQSHKTDSDKFSQRCRLQKFLLFTISPNGKVGNTVSGMTLLVAGNNWIG